MPTIRQVLAQKGSDVLSIAPDATVHDAIKRMADRDIGSLVVIDEGRLVGIFYGATLCAEHVPQRSLLSSDVRRRWWKCASSRSTAIGR